MNYQLNFDAERFGGLPEYEKDESPKMEDFQDAEGETGRHHTHVSRTVSMNPDSDLLGKKFELDLDIGDSFSLQSEVELPISVAPTAPASVSVVPRVLTYSAAEVLDDRISVPAQHSLVRLSKRQANSAAAVGLLEAVKGGLIVGIKCVNSNPSSKRAERLGKTWWTVIPKGEDAVLMLDPDNLATGAPLIAFRRELDKRDKYGCGSLSKDTYSPPLPGRLDAALVRVWHAYTKLRSGTIAACSLVASAQEQPSGDPTAPATCRASSQPSVPPLVHHCMRKALGFGVSMRNLLDTTTRIALRGYQRKKGLRETGDLDATTCNSLLVEGLPNRWVPALTNGKPGNMVTPLIRGHQTFEAMVHAMDTATTSDHYIYLLGWWLDDDFPLVPGRSTTTIQSLFRSKPDVQIRTMLWLNPFKYDRKQRVPAPSFNWPETLFVDSLPNGAAILDNRTLKLGSHHQKLLVVKGSQGLIGFCGGVDINPDRIESVAPPIGSPMHDVHCEVRGGPGNLNSPVSGKPANFRGDIAPVQGAGHGTEITTNPFTVIQSTSRA